MAVYFELLIIDLHNPVLAPGFFMPASLLIVAALRALVFCYIQKRGLLAVSL